MASGQVAETDAEQFELSRFDSVVIPAETVYGFTVGDDGVSFLLVRAGKAVSTLAGGAAS